MYLFNECSRLYTNDFRGCFSYNTPQDCVRAVFSFKNPNATWNKGLKFLKQSLAAWERDEKIKLLAQCVHAQLRSFSSEYTVHKKFQRLSCSYLAMVAEYENAIPAFQSLPREAPREAPRRERSAAVNPIVPPAARPERVDPLHAVPQEIRQNARYQNNPYFAQAVIAYERLNKEVKAGTAQEAETFLKELFQVDNATAMRHAYRQLAILLHPDKISGFGEAAKSYLSGLYAFMARYYNR